MVSWGGGGCGGGGGWGGGGGLVKVCIFHSQKMHVYLIIYFLNVYLKVESPLKENP